MKKFELMPTEENLTESLRKDFLKRNKDLVRFYELLEAQEEACSIAIDGRWGSGKTFFVKQSILIINAKNPTSKMEEQKRKNIMEMLPWMTNSDKMSSNSDVAIYYDAWANDNDTDPVLSLIYEIMKQLEVNFSLENNVDVLKIGGSILELFTGKNINNIIENLKSEDPIKKIREEKDLYSNIKKFFSEVLVERGNRLVVFIDELDRCKPSYTVQLLERIKHYLCDDRVTFVFSVNLRELQHTIKNYYGSTFDACRYLDRFFDMRVSLPPADKTEFYRELGLESMYGLEQVARKIIDTYRMEMREAIRFCHQVKTSIYAPTHDSNKWQFDFVDGNTKFFLLIYIIPILEGLKIVDISLYDEFVNGENSKPIMDIYKESDVGDWMASKLLNDDESYVKIEGKKLVTVEEKLHQVYEAVFVVEYRGELESVVVGRCEFNKYSKLFLRNAEGVLSKYADYEI